MVCGVEVYGVFWCGMCVCVWYGVLCVFLRAGGGLFKTRTNHLEWLEQTKHKNPNIPKAEHPNSQNYRHKNKPFDFLCWPSSPALECWRLDVLALGVGEVRIFGFEGVEEVWIWDL